MKEEKGIKEAFARLFNDPDRVKFKELLLNNTGEYDDLDFKREYISYDKLAKIILGMSNKAGGCVIFGVEEKEDAKLIPVGINDCKDKTDIKTKLSKLLPLELEYAIHDFAYDDTAEWGPIKNKTFQIILVEFSPNKIPFLSKKESGELKDTVIYCRKNTSTNEAGYYDIKEILEKRTKNTLVRKENDFKEHLDQCEELLRREAALSTDPSFSAFKVKPVVQNLLRRKIEILYDLIEK